MKRLWCELQTLWLTIQHWTWGGNEIFEGHVYQDQQKHEKVDVTLSRCINCGKKTMFWEKRK